VPFTLDLYTRSRDISAETFNPIPLLIVASLWYLFVTSILMVGQYFLERRFARGLDRVDLTKGARLPQGDAPSVDSIANARGESEERR